MNGHWLNYFHNLFAFLFAFALLILVADMVYLVIYQPMPIHFWKKKKKKNDQNSVQIQMAKEIPRESPNMNHVIQVIVVNDTVTECFLSTLGT